MVNVLYAVTSFTCCLVAVILPLRIMKRLDRKDPVDVAFLDLIYWTATFCFADGLWGIAASDLWMNSTALFSLSFVFHVLAAFTPIVWLRFMEAYLGRSAKLRLIVFLTTLVFAGELGLLIANFWTPIVFYVAPDGTYASVPTRRILFYLQYATYVLAAVVAVFRIVKGKLQQKNTHSSDISILLFVSAPIACGVFQMIYPDAPAYSIGYMLGCCIVYSFVVTENLEARLEENVRAQAASQAKTSFLFNMSHDIRTPMNAIVGFTERAIRHKDDEEILTDSLNKAASSGKYLLSIVNDVLDMARIESGKLELTEKVCDGEVSSRKLTEMFTADAARKDISFKVVTENITDRYLVLDEARANQIIANLLSNAIKYTGQGGTVEYSVVQVACPKPGYARFVSEIRDNGIGMAPEFRDHVFDAFEREKSATESGIQGTGLGMSIVKKLVDLMGGTVAVESELGKGTTIKLTLDHRIAAPEEIETWKAAQNGGISTDTQILKGKRVLLVDDNALNREIGQDILEELGVEVETAEDGDLAVETVRKHADCGESGYYDLILMDIQMPHMNGRDAAEAIRKLPNMSGHHLPIIALSANAFEEDRQLSLAAGMDEHISKPVDTDVLIKTLARLAQ